jgi:hypothetical protein
MATCSGDAGFPDDAPAGDGFSEAAMAVIKILRSA